MTRLFIGIDPGLTGAVAALDHNDVLISVNDMPTMKIGRGGGKVKSQIDAAGLSSILRCVCAPARGEVIVIVEKVAAMPAQGVSSVFSLGDSAGAIRGVVQTLSVPLEYVTAPTWKRTFKLRADKEEARAKAIMLYPRAPLGLKKHHGRAEAILIAKWGLMNLG